MADIYVLLKKDHDELESMLEELARGQQEHFERMASELKAHSEAEERTLYRALENRQETRDLIADGYREHKEAERLSQELMTAKGSSGGDFASKAKELRDALEHHIQEEEGTLFQKARAILSEEEAQSLGEGFVQSKNSMMQGAALAR